MQTFDIGRVNDEDDGGSVSIVAAPVRADTCLTTEILLLVSCLTSSLGRLAGDRGGGERTQTLKLRFLYVTDSTLKPMVGIVVTTSPICSSIC